MSEVASLLDQLEVRKPQLVLTVEGHKLPVTNLEKILWPGSGRSRPLTKRDLLRYLARVSPWLLPHLAGRPLFVTRYPDGVNGKSFYQKHWDNPPEFTHTVSIYSSHTEGDSDYLLCENVATLLWLGQMGGLELHPWFSRIDPTPDARGRGRKFSGSETTLEWSVQKRTGKIFFDYNQNTRGKSLASIFSPRRHPLGTVSMPVGWDELERVYPTDFTLRTVPGILEAGGDP